MFLHADEPGVLFPEFDLFAGIPDFALRDEDEFFITPDGGLIPMTGAYAQRMAEVMEPVTICIPGSADDPRNPRELPPWVVAHYVPELHPDDCDEIDGIPCTSVSRTLIDMAEVVEEAELRELFDTAEAKGMLDPEALAASRTRVEWRPSLEMLDRVIADYAA